MEPVFLFSTNTGYNGLFSFVSSGVRNVSHYLREKLIASLRKRERDCRHGGVSVQRSYCCHSCSPVFLDPFGTKHLEMFPSLFNCGKTCRWKVWWCHSFPQYSIQNRRILQECISGLLWVAFRLYMGMKLESGLWLRIKAQGGLLIIRTMCKREVSEPLIPPEVEGKDSSFRIWEKNRFQVSVAGLDQWTQ